MKKIQINTSKKYEVIITDSFDCFKENFSEVIRAEKVAVVTDENVAPLYLEEIKQHIPSEVFPLVLKSGESEKTVGNYLKIIEFLAKNGFSRSDAVVALGGGVIGDVAGFASATYLRGIPFVQCPTTLLSAVDSSVGGKTAVDLPEGKNMLGCFCQPYLVFINLKCLESLPKREILSGLGEVAKYSLLTGEINADEIEKKNYERLIYKCVEIKNRVVSADEFDRGARRILNLGHTVGHAVETLSGYSLSHGECVVKGLGVIIDISAEIYRFREEKKAEMKKVLSSFDLSINYPAKEIAKQILCDKKRDGNKINAVLLKDIGKPEVKKLDVSAFLEMLDENIRPAV